MTTAHMADPTVVRRVSPAAVPVPTRFHFLCERCSTPISAVDGIALACGLCTAIARAEWPTAPAVLGQASGT